MSSAGWLSRVTLVLALALMAHPVWGQTKKPAAKKTPQLSEELKQFDANGDGKLDANERKAAVAAKRTGAGAKAKADAAAVPSTSPVGGNPGIDPTQDPEFAKRFDLDGDGQLDENETQAMQSEIARLRAMTPPGGNPGGPPPGGPPAGGPPPGGPSGSSGGQPPSGPPGSGSRRGFGGGGPGGGGDRQARFQEMVKKYDSNGDGQLDDTERQAMQANYEKLRGEMMQKYDTNGDGQLDDNERQARDQARLQQYDKNGDGQIDDEERAAMPEYERVRGSRRGGGGPGGFGFGGGGFGGGGPGGFRGGPGGFSGGPLPEFMKQYDTNGDGQLNEQEQAAMQTAMRADFKKRQAETLKKYDANHNGQLDEKEQATMRSDYEKLRAEMMKKYDTNGDGNLDDNERTARDAARLKAYDRNSDGKLDESESAAMPEFERMRGGRGGPGGGGFGGGFGGPGGGFAHGGGPPGSADGGSRRTAQLPGNVKKYDTNNDGKLDDAERKAMQADQQKAKKPSGTTKPTTTKPTSVKSGQAKN